MNRFHLFAAALLMLPLAAGAADLRVAVSDGPATPSTLYIALYDSAATYAATQPLASQTAPLRNGAAQVAFLGLPPGRYALRAFADENGNGKMDANMLGIPTERYGFSNDARGVMGPPGFDAVALPVDAADVATTLHLH
ncbi:DUF2141 domain-containing protein [Variovorax sp. PAMC 28711]|uniref:DUF2141 domain-containing protein n=1 Tax=Variovorax sp. PAMC 28711 TaxID=1795631 RepID=UPI00078E9C37|nr:DUF2141 domain-containing protein [Variovorax sp. PAMC 28711]AMM24340.1 hypothetical protein AX767_08250 [Variovorax sp. PAMC 28711]